MLVRAIAGELSLVASPMRFSESPIKYEVPPPALGQYTDEILRGVLKKKRCEIAKLKEGGVVYPSMGDYVAYLHKSQVDSGETATCHLSIEFLDEDAQGIVASQFVLR
ncbi:MAG: hypothetical protein HYU73_09105 [Betaproteobacteria bacterium]|nr:hypothetical protein [Betaproteobacteria bacterium]